MIGSMFQFTHPGKGATDKGMIWLTTYPVSIHAPWEGCDGSEIALEFINNTFQFTHPGKGATGSSQFNYHD